MKARRQIIRTRISSQLVEEVITRSEENTIREAAEHAANAQVPFEIAHRVLLKPHKHRKMKR